jgi:hypothetical protein
MTSPSKQREPREHPALSGVRELGKDEKIARILLDRDKGHLWCLAPDCSFYITVPSAPVHVMRAELKDFFRDHRKHRHPHFLGPTRYDEQLGESWKSVSQS